MKERPILFSAPMVRALLDGSKTQTRRIMKPQPEPIPKDAEYGEPGFWIPFNAAQCMVRNEEMVRACPYGQPGDRLFVRETWANVGTMDPGLTVYRADYPACVPPGYENVPAVDAITWKPSIHMFRKDSRINLEIVSVRVERLQDITELDAIAEGIERDEHGWNKYGCPDESAEDPCDSYKSLWEQINGTGSWAVNPWVWVVKFKRDLDRKEGQSC